MVIGWPQVARRYRRQGRASGEFDIVTKMSVQMIHFVGSAIVSELPVQKIPLLGLALWRNSVRTLSAELRF